MAASEQPVFGYNAPGLLGLPPSRPSRSREDDAGPADEFLRCLLPLPAGQYSTAGAAVEDRVQRRFFVGRIPVPLTVRLSTLVGRPRRPPLPVLRQP